MEPQSMSDAPIAFTLADWRQAYREPLNPADLLHALRQRLSLEDNAWISLASAEQLDAAKAAKRRARAFPARSFIPMTGVSLWRLTEIPRRMLTMSSRCTSSARMGRKSPSIPTP